jgi:hypothetical protein
MRLAFRAVLWDSIRLRVTGVDRLGGVVLVDWTGRDGDMKLMFADELLTEGVMCTMLCAPATAVVLAWSGLLTASALGENSVSTSMMGLMTIC